MKHLLDEGHTRIALLSPDKYYTHKERIKGFRFAMMERGAMPSSDLEVLLSPNDAYMDRLETLLDGEHRPTAIFVTDPGLLEGLLELLNRKRLLIPEDLSVVTFDDNYCFLPSEYRDFFTSINQPGKLIGSLAVELLFRHWRTPDMEMQEIVLPGKLNVRRSTRSLL